MADASLERYINRKRLFVRVQANVPRELFVQKLNAAFPGARIGVGNANAERGPVTQRVADINYESAAEAVQALRRNRFKLKVGNHDADITYQIERKDVVEKLAGEWGCRFMVVVKNLPPGEISCAELSDMFETAGEIFTIKILPGNRGEPYALVQYVEEQSVELCIHQINQQKLHGAVLYVERHLKARRQGGGNSQSSAPPALSSPSSATPAGNQPLPASSSTPISSTTPSSRAVSAAAAVAGDTAATTPTATPTNQNARSAAAAALATQQQQQSQQQQQTPAQQQQAVSQVSTPSAPPISAPPVSVSVPPSLTSPMLSPTGASTPAQSSHHQLSTAPATPSSQPAKPTIDSSNSLFSNSYALGSKQDSTALFNGGTPSHSTTDNRLGVFGTDLSLITGNPLGVAPGLASPSSLLGPAAAVGGPSLRGATSVPASQGGLGPLGQSSSLGLGGTSGIAASHQVLTPMLDLFSHLREPANQAQSVGGALSASSSVTHSQQLDSLANSMSGANGNGLHGVSTSGAVGNSMSGYAGMLLRSSPGAPTPSTPGSLVSPVGNNANGQGGLGLQSASSIGSQMGGAPGPPGLLVSSGGGRMGAGAVQSTPGLMAHTPVMGPQGGHALPSPQSQQQQQQQVAAAAAASMGLARISIRDSLRLALGRLEEMVMCPLTGEIMRDPVIAADGYSYERTAIQTWMSAHNSSPLSGESLQHKILIPNRLAKDIIADILPS